MVRYRPATIAYERVLGGLIHTDFLSVGPGAVKQPVSYGLLSISTGGTAIRTAIPPKSVQQPVSVAV
ncbi:hypothetical protein BDK88_1939 [Natrinema hispanicum]|uniref:Uncharacterized protein n=1 Tax=Natrinema hispanicum TaxID=392421 RepID=A0A482Y937_9EURY|nr:hypothetical protein BDK88_1939 [Natrinema hispanicum]